MTIEHALEQILDGVERGDPPSSPMHCPILGHQSGGFDPNEHAARPQHRHRYIPKTEAAAEPVELPSLHFSSSLSAGRVALAPARTAERVTPGPRRWRDIFGSSLNSSNRSCRIWIILSVSLGDPGRSKR
jgi:hypothetical protein